MKMPGFCESCRKFTNVSVTARALARPSIAVGICMRCEEIEKTRRAGGPVERVPSSWARRGQHPLDPPLPTPLPAFVWRWTDNWNQQHFYLTAREAYDARRHLRYLARRGA
jgi:hypothetical protein